MTSPLVHQYRPPYAPNLTSSETESIPATTSVQHPPSMLVAPSPTPNDVPPPHMLYTQPVYSPNKYLSHSTTPLSMLSNDQDTFSHPTASINPIQTQPPSPTQHHINGTTIPPHHTVHPPSSTSQNPDLAAALNLIGAQQQQLQQLLTMNVPNETARLNADILKDIKIPTLYGNESKWKAYWMDICNTIFWHDGISSGIPIIPDPIQLFPEHL